MNSDNLSIYIIIMDNLSENDYIILDKDKKIKSPKKDVSILKDNKKDIDFNIDNFENICNGSNPKIFFKIYDYIKPNVYNIYIFVGSIDSDIKNIILKIESDIHSLTTDDKDKLVQKLGRFNTKLLTMKNDSGGTIKFIFDLINIDDNINIIKKKIFIYLSNGDDYINTVEQHLWIKRKNNLSQLELHNIFISISNNSELITKENLINNLSIITGRDKEEIEDDIDIEEDLIDLNIFVNSKKIKDLLSIRLTNLGYNYQNNNGELIMDSDPYKSIIDNPLLIDSQKDLYYTKDNFKLLGEYGHIHNNIIYLVNVKNIINYIKSSHITISDSDKLYKGFIKKYWPYIDYKNIFSDTKYYDKKSQDIYQETEKLLQFQQIMNDTIYNSYLPALQEVSYNNCGLLLSVIHINFPGGIETLNLDNIFDKLEVNKEMPFIKYKSVNINDIRYKIYKGVSDLMENGEPYIPEKKINSWRKNISVDKDGKTKITGIPKGISIRYFLCQDNKSENKFFTINIFRDAKIEVKIYWTEDIRSNLKSIKEVMVKCKEIIMKINKLNISLSESPYYKIPLPDPNFILKYPLETNTQIIFLNSIIQLNLSETLKFYNLVELSKYFYSYVSIINEEENLKKNILHLRYIKISNYEKMSNIEIFINRKYQEMGDIEGKDNIIIQSIKQNFNTTKDEAGEIYIKWKNSTSAENKVFMGKKYFLVKQEPGIDIKIQKQSVNNIYKIMIEGVKDITQLKHINNFIRSLLYLYSTNNNAIKNKMSQDVIEENISSSEKDGESDYDTLGMLKNEQIIKKGFVFSDSDEESEDISDNEEESEISEASKEKSEGKSKEKSEKIDKEISKADIFDTKLLLSIPIREYSLRRLYEADSELFKYEPDKTYQAYSKICGEVDLRQPIVITKNKKELIDRDHPGSYDQYLEYGTKNKKNIYICPKYWCIKCDTSLTEEEVYKTKEIYSVTVDKKTSEYIKINEDIVQNKEIIKTPSSQDSDGIINSDIILYSHNERLPNVKIMLPNNNFLNWEKGNKKINKKTVINKGDKLVFSKQSKFGSCPICDGKIIVKNNYDPEKKDHTVLVRESSYFKKDSNMYPGFLSSNSHPEGYCMPCCFKNWDTPESIKRREKCLMVENQEEDKPIEIKNERYIQGSEKFPLDREKLGMLPSTLNNLLGNDINKMLSSGKSGLLKEGIASFVRRGVNQSQNNSFLRAISYIHNREWNYRSEIEFIEKQIISKLTPELFSQLNNGNLVLIFRDDYNLNEKNLTEFLEWCTSNSQLLIDNDINELLEIKDIEGINRLTQNKVTSLRRIYDIYTGIKNYQSYLLSSSIKNEEYLWDLISRKELIFKNGMNLVIFNRSDEEDLEDIHIICPKGINDNLLFDREKDTCFLIKIGKYYEPIERIYFNNGKQESKKKFTFNKEDWNIFIRNILKLIEKIIVDNCNSRYEENYLKYLDINKINFKQYDTQETMNRINKIKSLNDRNEIKDQVVDYYNKVIGLFTVGGYHPNDIQKTFIPVWPSSSVNNIPIINDINITNFKNLISTYTSLQGFYHKLSSSKEKDIHCKPRRLIIKNNLVIGIQVINSGIIPINPVENLGDDKYAELIKLLEIQDTDNQDEIEYFLSQNPEFITLFEGWEDDKLTFIDKTKVKKELDNILTMERVNINLVIDYDKRITIDSDILDDRIKYIRKMNFENETYQNIKFEITKFLQLQNRKSQIYKSAIEKIINNKIYDNSLKRQQLKSYILEIILMLSSISDEKDIENIYSYDRENFREMCNKNYNKKTCNSKQHCIWDINLLESGEKISKNKKMLFKKIYSSIYEEYSSKLEEDIISEGIFKAHKKLFGSVNINKKSENKEDTTIFIEIKFILDKYVKDGYTSSIKDKDKENRGGKCKLYINRDNLIDNKNNLDKYSSLIVEDLLTNKIKSKEILNGILDYTVNNLKTDENSNYVIFTDIDFNEGKLKKLYEDGFNYFIKNKDIQIYNIISDDNFISLPVKWQQKLKYNFKLNPSNDIPINLLNCFSIIANQFSLEDLKNIFEKSDIHPGKYTYKVIRNIFLKHIERKEEIDEKPYWNFLINTYINVDDNEVLKDIKTFDSFKDYMKDDNYHWYNFNDLQIFQDIFKVNIIYIGRKTLEMDDFNLFYNQDYNYYILFYFDNIDNTGKYKFDLINLYDRYIFSFEDFSEEFKEMITSKLGDKVKIKKKPKIKRLKGESIKVKIKK